MLHKVDLLLQCLEGKVVSTLGSCCHVMMFGTNPCLQLHPYAYTHAVCSLQYLYLSLRMAYQLDRMSSTGRVVTVQFFKLQLILLRL